MTENLSSKKPNTKITELLSLNSEKDFEWRIKKIAKSVKLKTIAECGSIDVKILQTNDEAKYVTYIQRNRNKVDAYILNLNTVLYLIHIAIIMP